MKIIFKFFRLLRAMPALVLAVCLAGGAVSAQEGPRQRIQLIDRIVAVVNNEVITMRELSERVDMVERELRLRKTPLPDSETLQKQVLERLITQRVQLQQAREAGLEATDVQVDQAVVRIAASNNMSLQQFRQVLERDGIPFEKFREDLRREIILSRLRDREVNNRITVSESEVELYLAEQQSSKKTNVEYRLAHILIRVPEQASPEQIESLKSRAEDVLKRARAGDDFGQLSAAHSDAPEALKGGDLGWRSQDRLPDLFLEAVRKLKPGGVSEVLRSPAGFHVLLLQEERSGGAPLLVEQNKVRHILIRTNDLVSESEARRKLSNLRERIVNGVDFAELARLNSDDGSASSGGELGWVYPGDTVPEFENAMRELAVGEVSQPVKSPFGWHLIQVQERRTADMSSDRQRLEAHRILREKKSDEAYQEWLRLMRDRAYVEYRLEER